MNIDNPIFLKTNYTNEDIKNLNTLYLFIKDKYKLKKTIESMNKETLKEFNEILLISFYRGGSPSFDTKEN